ncbi:MAG TPA: c-type cytochrome [Bryobacteraceae bacterium]|nr:c-type cytochrome [Bryobacteraceae bacterium]
MKFAAIICSLVLAPLASRAQTSEQAFKNVRVLKGIPVDEFMATMGFFSASLGETCTDCHSAESGGSWAKYADDNPRKNKARAMIGMMNAINKTYFGGKREITCYSCHRGVERPDVTPNLADLYGPPPSKEPDELRDATGKTTVDQILDRFLTALGGADRLAAATSFTAHGTYQGYQSEKYPVDVYVTKSDQISTVVHTSAGDSATTFDGRAGWIAGPATERPVPLMDLTGGDLTGARLDAQLWFPAQVKAALTGWRAERSAPIDGQDMQMLQATADGRYPVNFYFDSKTGLLTRVVRYADSPVGLSPTQVDYADYRGISGVQRPFRITVTWLDGRSTTDFTSIQSNVPIDGARFRKP